jgi:hypothetical protein
MRRRAFTKPEIRNESMLTGVMQEILQRLIGWNVRCRGVYLQGARDIIGRKLCLVVDDQQVGCDLRHERLMEHFLLSRYFQDQHRGT